MATDWITNFNLGITDPFPYAGIKVQESEEGAALVISPDTVGGDGEAGRGLHICLNMALSKIDYKSRSGSFFAVPIEPIWLGNITIDDSAKATMQGILKECQNKVSTFSDALMNLNDAAKIESLNDATLRRQLEITSKALALQFSADTEHYGKTQQQLFDEYVAALNATMADYLVGLVSQAMSTNIGKKIYDKEILESQMHQVFSSAAVAAVTGQAYPVNTDQEQAVRFINDFMMTYMNSIRGKVKETLEQGIKAYVTRIMPSETDAKSASQKLEKIFSSYVGKLDKIAAMHGNMMIFAMESEVSDILYASRYVGSMLSVIEMTKGLSTSIDNALVSSVSSTTRGPSSGITDNDLSGHLEVAAYPEDDMSNVLFVDGEADTSVLAKLIFRDLAAEGLWSEARQILKYAAETANTVWDYSSLLSAAKGFSVFKKEKARGTVRGHELKSYLIINGSMSSDGEAIKVSLPVGPDIPTLESHFKLVKPESVSLCVIFSAGAYGAIISKLEGLGRSSEMVGREASATEQDMALLITGNTVDDLKSKVAQLGNKINTMLSSKSPIDALVSIMDPNVALEMRETEIKRDLERLDKGNIKSHLSVLGRDLLNFSNSLPTKKTEAAFNLGYDLRGIMQKSASVKNLFVTAAVRNNSVDVCPFGLSIPSACAQIGEHIKQLEPNLPNDSNNSKAVKSKRNQRLFRGVMQQSKSKSKCIYMRNMMNQDGAYSVVCNWGEANEGHDSPDFASGVGAYYPTSFFSGLFSLPVAMGPEGHASHWDRNPMATPFGHTTITPGM